MSEKSPSTSEFKTELTKSAATLFIFYSLMSIQNTENSTIDLKQSYAHSTGPRMS